MSRVIQLPLFHFSVCLRQKITRLVTVAISHLKLQQTKYHVHKSLNERLAFSHSLPYFPRNDQKIVDIHREWFPHVDNSIH